MPRAIIEQLGECHRSAIRWMAEDPELTRTSSVPYPFTDEYFDGLLQAIQTGAEKHFALKADDTCVGTVTLKKLNAAQKSGELSYWIGSRYRGQGFAQQAARLALDHVFEQLSFQRVDAHFLAVNNPASGHILAKLGFEPDPERPDMPVADRFANLFPGDVWTFRSLRKL